MRDVADPLELVLLLVERAIAGVDAQRIPERNASSAVQSEGGHAGSIEVINVQARNAGVLGRRGPQPVRIDEDPIAEEAEAEVGQPVRTDHVIGGVAQTLIAERGRAGEGAERRAAGQEAKSSGGAQIVPHEAVASEHMQLLALVPVHPHVEGVTIEDAETGGAVIGARAGCAWDVREGDCLQQFQSLLRQHRRRNDAASKFLALLRVDVAVRVDVVTQVEDACGKPAQVAGPFRRRRHARRQGAAVRLPLALIVSENEGLVFLNRRAERAAELIPEGGRDETVGRARQQPGLREGIAGGPRAAATELKRAAVILVTARLRLRGNESLARLSELGVVGSGGDLQFRKRVQIGSDDWLAQDGIAIVRPVKQERDAAPILPADVRPEEGMWLLAGGGGAARLDARNQEVEPVQVAPEDR